MAQLVTPTSKTIGIWICLAAATLSAPSQTFGQDAKKPVKKDTRVWYRLVNVTIPAGSPLRKLESIDSPPQIKVIVKKDGVKIGQSDNVTGWRVDFPAKNLKNQFPIRLNSAARYTLEVWDDDLFSDDLIFTITQVKGEQFKERISQAGTKLDDETTLATLEWKEIPVPKKYINKK